MTTQRIDYISLLELQQRVKGALDGAFPLPVWVVAEVSELKVNQSGHCFLELVEGSQAGRPQARAGAVIWKDNYPAISTYFRTETGRELSAGLKILAKVLVGYHALYGFRLQLVDIEPSFTIGDIEREKQLTIIRLREEGVYDMNRELEFPGVAQRIAVVSSGNAAGYQDFCQEIGAAKGGLQIETTLFAAVMQGAGTEDSIIAALDRVLENLDRFDAVVVIRGGGSQSDLGCFNGYRLCSYMAQFPLPILTGIGHDKDESVADEVAWRALKTPTAVAVFLQEQLIGVDDYLVDLGVGMREQVAILLRESRERLRMNRLQVSGFAQEFVHAVSLKLQRYGSEIGALARLKFQQEQTHLETLRGHLSSGGSVLAGECGKSLQMQSLKLRELVQHYLVDRGHELSVCEVIALGQLPERLLGLGYAIVRRDGKLVRDVDRLAPGTPLHITFSDGEVTSVVQSVKKSKNQFHNGKA